MSTLSPGQEQQLLALGQRWADAELRADTDALSSLLDRRFMAVGPLGFILTYDQWLERHQTGALRYQSFVWQDIQLRDFADTVIAIGMLDQQATYEGHDAGGRFRATQNLVRGADGWRIAGLHLSPIGAPPAFARQGDRS
jgi:hypothetical protein